ncbi:ComEC/Rec2 family competence protein [Paracoccus binzhouensis]|uniref:ComEC/Rec2 family competence protein n=1 Tax=Paracoccus binzhouensis TaxID=2796149 RepID=UPI001E56B8ED|nr:ComEC/Rec2 family competence protein [Paracoccus binzhouensis]
MDSATLAMARTGAPPAGWPRASALPSRMPARVPVTVRAGLLPWVPFWLSLGIGGWFLLRNEPGPGFYARLALAAGACLLLPPLVLGLARRRRCAWIWADRCRLAAMALLLVLSGAGLAGLRAHLVAAPVLEFRYYGPVEGRVIGIDRSSSDRMRLLLDRVVLADVPPRRTPARVRISLMSPQDLPAPGQRIMLTAHLSPPSGPSEPGGFDFRRLAWFERLGAVGHTQGPVMTVARPADDGALALHRLRMALAETMRDHIGGQAGAVSAALVTGDRSGISERTNEIMRASNLYHIISISGLHMSMLAGFVYAALRLAGTAGQGLAGFRALPVHKLAAAGALAVSALYLWLSGGGVATERAFIMVAVMLLAIIADRRAVSLRTVAVAGTLVLLLGPEALTEPGFQMSFAATVALILVQEPWLKLAPRLPWWSRPVLMLLLSSVVASLATSPIAAVHFGRMTQYGLLANLLVVPVVGTLVMPGAVFAALLAPLGLAQPALWVMGLGTQWMLLVAGWISDLDGAVLLLPAAPAAVLPLLGIGAALLFLGPLGEAANRMALQVRRSLGALLLAGAALIWLAAERPAILVAPDGKAVAAMTAAGRVPSKPRGGSYAIANWLEADGDPADQVTAAARPLWQGEPSDRRARLAFGDTSLEIRHLTGKGARKARDIGCPPNLVLVTDGEWPMNEMRDKGCTIIDITRLRDRGAISIGIDRGRLDIVSADGPGRGRIWQ